MAIDRCLVRPAQGRGLHDPLASSWGNRPNPGTRRQNQSALNHSGKTNGAMLLAEQKGAAAVIIVLGIPGNFATQLWGSGGEGPDLTKVPWFSVGNDDGTALRELIDSGAPVKIRMRLAIENRSLRPSAVFIIDPVVRTPVLSAFISRPLPDRPLPDRPLPDRPLPDRPFTSDRPFSRLRPF